MSTRILNTPSWGGPRGTTARLVPRACAEDRRVGGRMEASIIVAFLPPTRCCRALPPEEVETNYRVTSSPRKVFSYCATEYLASGGEPNRKPEAGAALAAARRELAKHLGRRTNHLASTTIHSHTREPPLRATTWRVRGAARRAHQTRGSAPSRRPTARRRTPRSYCSRAP